MVLHGLSRPRAVDRESLDTLIIGGPKALADSIITLGAYAKEVMAWIRIFLWRRSEGDFYVKKMRKFQK